MPVKITYKKSPSSNETQTLPENTPVKAVKEPEATNSGPGPIHPFIDRISVVLTISDNKEAHAIYGNTFVQFKDTEVFKSAKDGVWGPYKTARRVALPSLINSKKWPLLQCALDSQSKLATAFRTEFSPVDLGPQGLDELHAQLMSLVPDGWAYFVAHGRVTMIEVTVDLPNISVDQFHLVPQQGLSAKTWKANGQLESLVLGKSGGNQTKVYDRGKKRIAAGQKWTGPTTTRLERRLRPQPALPLAQLANLANPFASMQLILPQLALPPEEKKPYIWDLFVDSVTVRGLSTTLKLLPTDKRTLYRKWLLKHPVSWWQPDEIWAQWPSVLEHLKIASPYEWH